MILDTMRLPPFYSKAGCTTARVWLGAVMLICGTCHAADVRIGIIGCDTSHVPAFTEAFNGPVGPSHVAGGQVVAAFKGGSPDIKSSWSRVGEYSKVLEEKYHVRFYDSIDELCQHVDAVLLESVDGRPHLDQARPVLRARKRLFIDKPMAGSLKDAVSIFKLAKEQGTPVFSSSSLRFATNTQAVRHGAIGKVTYAETYGPCELEPHHPDLFWYGVHGVEALYTIMGTGCLSVVRGTTAQGKIEVTGLWPDGRKGIFREHPDFHGIAKGTESEQPTGFFDGYLPLAVEIMGFFQSGIAPVSPEETLEIFAFMEAADESKRQNGAAVRVAEVLKNAENQRE